VGTIKQIIWAAGHKYNVSYSWLLSVAECESGLDPTAVNRSSGASGLFQFMPATFYGHGGTDIWNPTQQADIAAKMFSIGESSEWVCK
jgi:soluble lytic murein transglycosylase-like protein